LNDKELLPPDYIFLDINMPRLDGKECLRKIKSIARLDEVPVILYSTSKLRGDVIDAMKMGAVYFLTKPTKSSVLKRHVSNILEGKWELIHN
jgi:PleD family two-component response regulator